MKNNTIFYSFISFFIFLLFWQVSVSIFEVNTTLFPSPWMVFHSLFESRQLFSDIVVSLIRLLAGVVMGIVMGIVVGLFTGRVSIVNDTLGQILNFFRFIPPLALVPLFIVWMGIGEISKISLLAWTAFFPVWISTFNGARNIEKNYLLVAKSLDVKWFFMLKDIIIKGSIEYILNGARIGISFAFSVLVAAEMLGAYVGIGHRIATFQSVYRIDKMIGYIIILGIFGLIVDKFFVVLSRKITPWKNGS